MIKKYMRNVSFFNILFGPVWSPGMMLKLQQNWFLGKDILVYASCFLNGLVHLCYRCLRPFVWCLWGFNAVLLAQCPGVNRIHFHQGWFQVNFSLMRRVLRRVLRKDNKQRETSIFSVIYHFGDLLFKLRVRAICQVDADGSGKVAISQLEQGRSARQTTS